MGIKLIPNTYIDHFKTPENFPFRLVKDSLTYRNAYATGLTFHTQNDDLIPKSSTLKLPFCDKQPKDK